MAWTASKTAVTTKDGVLYVTVRYTDGVKAFEETYRSNGAPAAEWIEKTAAARLAQIEGVEKAVIAPGTVASPTPVVPDTKREAFRKNIAKARRVADLLAIGALLKTDQEVVDLADAIGADIGTYWEDV